MRDSIALGPAPFQETPAQVGEAEYRTNALRECQTYIQAIRNYVGPEPEGARLDTRAFDHDLGKYYEVVCAFNPNEPEAVDYAFRCERQAPATWKEGGVRPPPKAGSRRRLR